VGRLIPAGTGLAHHQERRRRRQRPAMESPFMAPGSGDGIGEPGIPGSSEIGANAEQDA